MRFRRSKFNAKRSGPLVQCKNGKIRPKYASGKEAKRAAELQLLEKLGEIQDLREQVPYVVIPKQKGEKEATYIADFEYFTKDGVKVTEDAKGMKTSEYRLKRKLMLHVHGIKVLET